MDKLRQKYLQKWLRAQQQPVKKLMRTNIALATLSSLILVAQTYFLATLLDKLIMQNVDRAELVPYFIALIITFALRAVILWLREKIGFKAGRLLRNHMRQKILDKIHQVGPATINNKPAGSWASIMLEQVENLHNFYARFLPQQSLSAAAIPTRIIKIGTSGAVIIKISPAAQLSGNTAIKITIGTMADKLCCGKKRA